MKKREEWCRFLSSAVEQSSEGIGVADLNHKKRLIHFDLSTQIS